MVTYGCSSRQRPQNDVSIAGPSSACTCLAGITEASLCLPTLIVVSIVAWTIGTNLRVLGATGHEWISGIAIEKLPDTVPESHQHTRGRC
jgi:hypothetical protein